jgi:putative MATE family efflux protein
MKAPLRSTMLADQKIGKLLYSLSMPAIVGMLVQAMYNVVDAIFVGQAVGAVGISAIAVVFPIQLLVMALAQTIGVGGASLISRRMGAKAPDDAGLTFGNMLLLAEILGIALLIAGFVATEPILRLFGTTPVIMEAAKDYFQIIVVSFPLMTLIMCTNNAVRAEGNAKMAMAVMLIGAVLNILLDPLFIFVFNMGVQGAAIATLLAHLIAGVFLIAYFLTGRSEIPVGLKFIRLNGAIVKEIIAVGSATLARFGAMSFATALLNNTLGTLGGTNAIAAFGIVFRILSFIYMPLMGLSQGLQPIIGFNFGAKNILRVRQSLKLANISATAVALGGFLILIIFPEAILGIFSNDTALIQTSCEALKYMVIGLPLIGYQMVGSALFQALGKPLPALLLALLRQVLVLIPLIIILPKFWGLDGIWLAFPFADGLSFLLTVIMVIAVMKSLPAIETEPTS